MSRWIRFSLVSEEGLPGSRRKTRTWHVVAKESGFVVGRIAWYTPWRKYAFEPIRSAVFEQDCLRDIADFIEQRTREHRNALPLTREEVAP